jgi:hypothetical protein
MCVDYFLIFLNNKREKEKLKKSLMRRQNEGYWRSKAVP